MGRRDTLDSAPTCKTSILLWDGATPSTQPLRVIRLFCYGTARHPRLSPYVHYAYSATGRRDTLDSAPTCTTPILLWDGATPSTQPLRALRLFCYGTARHPRLSPYVHYAYSATGRRDTLDSAPTCTTPILLWDGATPSTQPLRALRLFCYGTARHPRLGPYVHYVYSAMGRRDTLDSAPTCKTFILLWDGATPSTQPLRVKRLFCYGAARHPRLSPYVHYAYSATGRRDTLDSAPTCTTPILLWDGATPSTQPLRAVRLFCYGTARHPRLSPYVHYAYSATGRRDTLDSAPTCTTPILLWDGATPSTRPLRALRLFCYGTARHPRLSPYVHYVYSAMGRRDTLDSAPTCATSFLLRDGATPSTRPLRALRLFCYGTARHPRLSPYVHYVYSAMGRRDTLDSAPTCTTSILLWDGATPSTQPLRALRLFCYGTARHPRLSPYVHYVYSATGRRDTLDSAPTCTTSILLWDGATPSTQPLRALRLFCYGTARHPRLSPYVHYVYSAMGRRDTLDSAPTCTTSFLLRDGATPSTQPLRALRLFCYGTARHPRLSPYVRYVFSATGRRDTLDSAPTCTTSILLWDGATPSTQPLRALRLFWYGTARHPRLSPYVSYVYCR